MALTRRQFLKSGMALVSISLAVPSVFTRAVGVAESGLGIHRPHADRFERPRDGRVDLPEGEPFSRRTT